MKTFDEYLKESGEYGTVIEVVNFLCHVNGLPGLRPGEIVVFASGGFGNVVTLAEEDAEILMLSKDSPKVGTKATRTGSLLEVGVGDSLLGNVLDGLGDILDQSVSFKSTLTYRPVDVAPPGISDRKRISRPLDTGVALVDILVPLGKGQRQLVIGDRKTGKSNFILQAMHTQSNQGSVCIYVGIGKKYLDIKKMQEYLLKNDIWKNSIIVSASSRAPAGMIYTAPYTAMSIAEYFRDQGRDVLLVFDDLTTHAKTYREIALLGRRFPGRNSYPADIFYVHARLLERAGNFLVERPQKDAPSEKKEASISCLPVAETTQGDLSGYIQTNLMSMTDGHIFFDSDLFLKGRRPAVNPFLSVTRVGRQTQNNTRREISREILSFLTLYEKTERFIHFGAEASDSLKNTIATAERIHHFFDQSSSQIIDTNLQVLLFVMLWGGVWQDKDLGVMFQEVDVLTQVFAEKESFRTTVADLLASANSFNDLIGKMRKHLDELQSVVRGQQEATAKKSQAAAGDKKP